MLDSFKEDPKLRKLLFSGHFGLEKENIRVTSDGKLALTPHPAILVQKRITHILKPIFRKVRLK